MFCRAVLIKDEHLVCGACPPRLPRTTSDRKLEGGMVCLAPLRFEDEVRESIHRFKFGGRSFYSGAYARIMAEEVAKLPPGTWDTITWVPVSKRRLRQRGYDQAQLLARDLGTELGCTPLPLLKKIRNNKAQSSLVGEKKRRDNVKDVYTLTEGAEIAGKKILLVDDVATTGATLNACRKVLLGGGAAGVTAIVIASAAKEK